MLNRMRGCITLTLDDELGQRRPHYCLFPATTHVDHLVKLIQVLGPPDAAVLARISDEYVTKFVLSKVGWLVPPHPQDSPLFGRSGPRA